MQLRQYQRDALNKTYAWLGQNEGNPCLVLPTGSGKSIINAALCKETIQHAPSARILMLTHVKELVQQNFDKMRAIWPNAPVGVYAASLNRKEIDAITFASIQSIYNQAPALGHIDLVIIDECHLASHTEQGTYRDLISALSAINPALRVIGLTATPWRLGHGVITGDGALFDDLIKPITIQELIELGHLKRLKSKMTEFDLKPIDVKERGGEYVAKDLQHFVNQDEKNRAIVDEIIREGKHYRSWLIFATGIEHAKQIQSIMIERGIPTGIVTGKTKQQERDETIKSFKSLELKALVNCDVLTTGFDFPGIDLIAMLRPTKSPTLYVQMAGRGMRPCDHIDYCRVLDFAGNVREHGPVTNVQPPRKRGKGKGQAPIKVCDHCFEICYASAKVCTNCGAEFPVNTQAVYRLYDDDIMGLMNDVMDIASWKWEKHVSTTSGKEMLKVKYYPKDMTLSPIQEYLTITHEGYAGTKARKALQNLIRLSGANTNSVIDVTTMADALNTARPPCYIEYRKEGKFHAVTLRAWEKETDRPGVKSAYNEAPEVSLKHRKVHAAAERLKMLGVSDKRIYEICLAHAGIGLEHLNVTSQQAIDKVYEEMLLEIERSVNL